MKIEKEIRDDHQVKLTVEMDADPFERAKHRAARQIAKRIKIPGFRPGKAPYGVILRTVGEDQIVENALELLIDEQYPEIIKQAELEPYGPGTLDNIPEMDPLTLEFVVPLNAEVELGDYKSVRIPFEVPETTAEDVQDAINRIREQKATRESVDRPAQIGDTVFMRVSGVRTDIEDEEEEPTIVEERFSSSVIREETREDEFPFPGFSKELIGLSPEDQKTIHHKFPEDDEQEEFQGAEVDFSVVITNVQSTTLPDLNDEFAKEASEFETVEEWQAGLKEQLQQQQNLNYADDYDDQIMDQIIADSTIKYPPQMVDNEANEMIRGLEYRLSQQGMTKDLYLQIRGMDDEALLEEIKPIAEDRLKRTLALFEIARNEAIKIDQERVQSETFRTFDALSSQMTPNEAKKLTKSRFLPNLMTNITMDLTTQTTMDFLRATAKGEPWPPEEEKPEDEEGKEKVGDNVKAEDGTLESENVTAVETTSETVNESQKPMDVPDEDIAEKPAEEAVSEQPPADTDDNAEDRKDTSETT